MCELIDGHIVKKPIGRREAHLATWLSHLLNQYLATKDLGFVCGADLLIRFAPSLLLGPDVTFTAWDRCPGGQVPDESVAAIPPNLAVEVLSPSNRPSEMARKLDAYFAGGVQLVWLIDPTTRTATVHTARQTWIDLGPDDAFTGGTVLPGFTLPLCELFARLA